MPKPCAVCAHAKRAEIDLALSVQVVNVAELARGYGLKRDSVRRHRERHLSDFLAAFVAQAAPLEAGTIRAEAQRLYLTTLDALAQAQAGVLVALQDDGDGNVIASSKVSMSTVARLIRESRAGLELLTKLSLATGADNTTPQGIDRELDERIALALEKVAARHTMPTISIDPVDIISDAEVVPNVVALQRAPRLGVGTPGPSAAAAGGTPRDLKESQLAREQSEHDEGAYADHIAAKLGLVPEEEEPVTDLSAAASSLTRPTPYVERTWEGNPAASAEERRAAGFQPIPLSFPRRPSDD